MPLEMQVCWLTATGKNLLIYWGHLVSVVSLLYNNNIHQKTAIFHSLIILSCFLQTALKNSKFKSLQWYGKLYTCIYIFNSYNSSINENKGNKTSHRMLWNNHYRTMKNWLYRTSKHFRIDFIRKILLKTLLAKGGIWKQ